MGRYDTRKRGAHPRFSFYSCPMDRGHLWTALRYTELNPVRAGLARQAAEWPWSSAAGGRGGRGQTPRFPVFPTENDGHSCGSALADTRAPEPEGRRRRRSLTAVSVGDGDIAATGIGDEDTGATTGAAPCAPIISTGAMKRYPRRCIVSTKRGLSAESPSASRNLLMAAFRPCSKSTNVSAGQSFLCNSSRVTTWPGCSSSIART